MKPMEMRSARISPPHSDDKPAAESGYRFKCPFCGKKYVQIPTVEIPSPSPHEPRMADACHECGCDLILGIDQDPPEGWPVR